MSKTDDDNHFGISLARFSLSLSWLPFVLIRTASSHFPAVFYFKFLGHPSRIATPITPFAILSKAAKFIYKLRKFIDEKMDRKCSLGSSFSLCIGCVLCSAHKTAVLLLKVTSAYLNYATEEYVLYLRCRPSSHFLVSSCKPIICFHYEIQQILNDSALFR